MTNQDLQIKELLSNFDVPSAADDFFDRLRSEMDTPAPEVVTITKHKRPVFYAVPAAAAILVVALVAGVTHSQSDRGFQPKLASQIVEKTSSKLASIKTLSGTVNVSSSDTSAGQGTSSFDDQPIDFRWRSDGSFWSSPKELKPHAVGATAYDSKTNTYTGAGYGTDPLLIGGFTKDAFDAIGDSLDSGDGGGGALPGGFSSNAAQEKFDNTLAAFRYTGYTGPGVEPLLSSGESDQITNIAGALELFKKESTTATFVGTTYEGRSAWRVDLPTSHLSDDLLGDFTYEMSVTVDKETLLPYSVHTKGVTTYQGERYESTEDVKLSNLAVNPKLNDSSFTVAPPAGVTPQTDDAGVKIVPIEKASQVAGYGAEAATWIPDGFKLQQVLVGPKGNQQFDHYVELYYTNGLRSLAVEVRTAFDGESTSFPGDVQTASKLTSGSFGNVDATLDVSSTVGAAPKVTATKNGLRLTVIGQLDGADLLHVANSMGVQK